MFGSVGLGLGSVPLIAWIGVSPIILMQESHLSVFAYALWQFPVFLASIAGTIVMRALTHILNLSRLTLLGAYGMALSALITFSAIFLLKGHYSAIILGTSCYAFSWSFTSSPLTRLTLFSTFIPKGTASAVMNLILMLIIALGNQIAGFLYIYYKNLSFNLFCAAIGIIYLFFYYLYYKNSIRFEANKEEI